MKNWIWNYSSYGPKISFFTGVSHSVIDMIKDQPHVEGASTLSYFKFWDYSF